MNRRKQGWSEAGARMRALAFAVAALAAATGARGDEPYARSRTYDLQHARIELRFDTSQRKVSGQVTHTLALLRDAEQVEFDAVDLTIQEVAVGGHPARHEAANGRLRVELGRKAKAGERFIIRIRYEAQPKKGLYFILPDADHPNRPIQVWTQGETEDTRYYIPIYDYPNDKTTTEMILTVPAEWTTLSNGRLVSTRPAGAGMKTWHWRQSEPHSTYLIAVVAGEFDVVTDTWRGKPVTYYAPRGRGDRLRPTYGRTPEMLEFFSSKFGPYPWAKYAQAMVDEFVAGGMENTSATINTSSSLTHTALVPEYVTNQDPLISHEAGHQWFGDLVTAKDWGHVWLNESFASYMEALWEEHHFGADEAAYSGWREQEHWFDEERLFTVPLVTHNFQTFVEVVGNVYGKGSRILHMLHKELGDDDFFRACRHFLETHRYQNAVSADFARAVEESTGRNVDRFFEQWIYGAGAPKLALSYSWDEAAKQVKLAVKQTQKVEGRVGLFRFDTTVEITTPAGTQSHPLTVSQAEETFSFPAGQKPLLVTFDPQNVILKQVEFTKEPAEWAYQLLHAPSVAMRLDAARALREVKDNLEVVAALGTAATSDAYWGVRTEAVRSLGAIGGPAAQQRIVAVSADEHVTVRRTAVEAMGRFKDDAANVARLEKLYREDKAWRVRQAAVGALARQKPENGFALLQEALSSESPDDILRNQALQGLGELGKAEAVPLLLQWAAADKPEGTRRAAIRSLAQLDKKNPEITHALLGFLEEPRRSPAFQFVTFSALVQRGDREAVERMEAWLEHGDIIFGLAEYLRPMLAQLKQPPQEKAAAASAPPPSASGAAAAGPSTQELLDAVQRLEKAVGAMNERLKKIEERVGQK